MKIYINNKKKRFEHLSREGSIREGQIENVGKEILKEFKIKYFDVPYLDYFIFKFTISDFKIDVREGMKDRPELERKMKSNLIKIYDSVDVALSEIQNHVINPLLTSNKAIKDKNYAAYKYKMYFTDKQIQQIINITETIFGTKFDDSDKKSLSNLLAQFWAAERIGGCVPAPDVPYIPYVGSSHSSNDDIKKMKEEIAENKTAMEDLQREQEQIKRDARHKEYIDNERRYGRMK